MGESKNFHDYIAVARGSDLVIIRVVGRGNMVTAPGLADFVEEQRRAKFTRFVFDMERCRGLDSTFIGVMVGMYTSLMPQSGLYQSVIHDSYLDANVPVQSQAQPAPIPFEGSISAVNVSPELYNLLEMLGADRFVKMGGTCDLKQLEMTILPEKVLPADERQRMIKRAHENLVEIDKRNEAKFGEFLKMLSKELA